MADIRVTDTQVELHLTTAEHLLAVHRDQSAPLSALANADVVENPIEHVHGFRVGEGIPGVSAIGSFTSTEEKIFAVVHAGQHRGLVLRFREGAFDTWVIGCDDPTAVMDALRAHGFPAAG